MKENLESDIEDVAFRVVSIKGFKCRGHEQNPVEDWGQLIT